MGSGGIQGYRGLNHVQEILEAYVVTGRQIETVVSSLCHKMAVLSLLVGLCGSLQTLKYFCFRHHSVTAWACLGNDEGSGVLPHNNRAGCFKVRTSEAAVVDYGRKGKEKCDFCNFKTLGFEEEEAPVV